MCYVAPPPKDPQYVQMQQAVKVWLNNDSNGWADNLNSQNCVRARFGNIPARQFNSYSLVQGKDYGTFYAVWTEWVITATRQPICTPQLEIEVCFYPEQSLPVKINGKWTNQMKLHQEGYEVRMFFRKRKSSPHRLLINHIPPIERVCAQLVQKEGFEDVSQLNDNPVDYSKVFHDPVTFDNIKRDTAPYIGRLHGGGQHLEPYIKKIISVL